MFKANCLAILVLCLSTGAFGDQNTPIVPMQPCCGVKPSYTDPAYTSVFTGQVALVTYEQVPPSPNVFGIIDLKGITTGTATNTNYVPPVYVNSAWTAARLGGVFGVTLDDQGNTYLAATTIYGSKAVGTGGTYGTIYKIANGTGAVTNLATLPSDTVGTMNAAGLGNIAFDCDTHTLFVSDLANGLIYQLNPSSGAILASWDHGIHLSTPITDDPSKTYTPLGRRVWAVRTSAGRLYYSVWWWNPGEVSAPHANEIWSVGLNSSAGFQIGTQRLEISMPSFPPGTTWSNPVAGINFGPGGKILLAERSMTTSGGGVVSTSAHQSRALEYVLPQWTPTPQSKFQVSVMTPPTSNAGGADYDFTPGAVMGVWAMGDALQFNPAIIYGIQGMPATGGNVTNSILIDVSGGTAQQNKTQLGSVDIPCPACVPAQVEIRGPATACQSPGSYCASGPLGSTFAWSVTGGTFTIQSATCINVSWNATGPYGISVTTTQPNGCRTVTAQRVPACPVLCCDSALKAVVKSITTVTATHYSVSTALTAPIGNVKRIVATVVSTYQQYSPASCGPSSSVWSYVNSAPPQNGFASFLPAFWREVTWTHPTGVPINNTVFTFELAVPPPPAGDCTDQIQFCVRWEFTSTDCHTCEITTCSHINRGIPSPNPNPVGSNPNQ